MLTNNSHSIGQQVTTGNLVESTQVGKTRSTDLAPVGSLATITDQVHGHLALGSLNGRVGLTRRHRVTLSVQKEVVDQSLHVLLHGSTRRRRHLVVLNLDGARGHLVQALVDDAEGLTELLHTAEVAVVAVTVDTNGDVELDLVVGVVGLGLADIPWHTGTTEHDTGETHVQCIRSVDNANTLGSGLPDTVVCEKFFGLIDTVTELSGPLVDIVQKTDWDILRDTTRADVGGVETGTGNTLVEFLSNRPQSVAVSEYRHFKSHTMSFSRSSKPHKKGVKAPTSIA